MSDRFEGSLVAGVRYVRTAEGAKHFRVPIGSKITTDSHGNVVTVNGKPAAAQAAPQKTVKVNPDRLPKKFVATVPGQKAKIVALKKRLADRQTDE